MVNKDRIHLKETGETYFVKEKRGNGPIKCFSRAASSYCIPFQNCISPHPHPQKEKEKKKKAKTNWCLKKNVGPKRDIIGFEPFPFGENSTCHLRHKKSQNENKKKKESDEK